MADVSDIESALVETVTNLLYPSGPGQSSIVGALCRIYRGWPNTATLNTDLAAGNINVTVISDNESGRTTTRYLPEWHTFATPPGTTTSVHNASISISGAPAAGDVVGVLIDNVAYTYRVQNGDSAALVASNLSLAIQANRIVNTSGATISVPGARTITARTVCDAVGRSESRRQEKDCRVIAWCPSPSTRDVATTLIDEHLSGITFLALSDGSDARLVYKGTASHDQSQNALLYRRDLVYTVEFPTIVTDSLPSMLFGVSEMNSNITYG
jgi:hypothetical protein